MYAMWTVTVYLMQNTYSKLDILLPDLTEGVAEYCLSTQTYEGGFGGEPGNEGI